MAFKELIGSGYVELTADDKKLGAALDRTDAKMKKVEQTALRFGGGLSKAFLGGFGIGSAEQVIGRVASAISDLTSKMSQAAREGKSVGDAIAMWAAETTGVDNAVSSLNKRLERQNELLKLQAETEEQLRKLRGLPEATAEERTFATREAAIQQMRKEAAALEKDLGNKSAFDRIRDAAVGVATGGQGADFDAAKRERLKGMQLDIQQAESALRQDRGQVGDALGANAEAARREGEKKANEAFRKEESERLQKRGEETLAAAAAAQERMRERDKERQRRAEEAERMHNEKAREAIDAKIEAKRGQIDELRGQPTMANRFSGVEEFYRGIQEGANDQTDKLEKQIKLHEQEVKHLEAIRKNIGKAVFAE